MGRQVFIPVSLHDSFFSEKKLPPLWGWGVYIWPKHGLINISHQCKVNSSSSGGAQLRVERSLITVSPGLWRAEQPRVLESLTNDASQCNPVLLLMLLSRLILLELLLTPYYYDHFSYPLYYWYRHKLGIAS